MRTVATADDLALSDVFDSRDVTDRIDELEVIVTTWSGDSKQEDVCDSCEKPYPSHIRNEGGDEWCPTSTAEDREELKTLREFDKEGADYSGDWKYGETVIADSYFEEYAQSLAEDIGAIGRDLQWPLMYIDWKAAADALKQDYTEIELLGHSFWVRS